MLIYKHALKSGHLWEVEQVLLAYKSLGWEYVDIEPEDPTVLPQFIVFKWPFDCVPAYPGTIATQQ